MKKNIFYVVMMSMLVMGCQTNDTPNHIPTNLQAPSKEAADCVADGPGCHQFNPNL